MSHADCDLLSSHSPVVNLTFVNSVIMNFGNNNIPIPRQVHTCMDHMIGTEYKCIYLVCVCNCNLWC